MPRYYSNFELLAEHLQLLPTDFIDSLYLSSQTILCHAFEGLQRFCCSLAPNDENIEKHLMRFEEEIESTLSFDVLQQYLFDSVFWMPPDLSIQLDHYRDLDLTLTAEHEMTIDKELQAALEGVMAQWQYSHCLKRKHAFMNSQLQQLNSLQQQLATLPLSEISRDRLQHVVNDVSELQASIKQLQTLIGAAALSFHPRYDKRIIYLQRLVQAQL